MPKLPWRLLPLLALAACAAGPGGPASAPAPSVALETARSLYKAGRYAETEPLLRAELALAERRSGPDHPDVAAALNNLGVLFVALARYREAEPLYRRALEIRERAFGPEDPAVASSMSELGVLYVAQARYEEARPLYERALEIRREALGEDDPQVAQSVNNLGVLEEALGRPAVAEPLYVRAIEIQERALSPDHPDLAASVNNLAVLRAKAGRPAEAEPLYQRALAIHERALRPDHPKVAASLNNLAAFYEGQGRLDEAVAAIRRAGAIQRGRVIRDARLPTPGAPDERLTRALIFPSYVGIGWEALGRGAPERAPLIDETFQAGQLARATDTGAALDRVAARFAAGDGELAMLIREQQDRAEEWRNLDLALIEAVSLPAGERDAVREGQIREALAALDARLDALGDEMTRRFPEYAELTSPEPAAIAELQPLLRPDEALLAYYATPGEAGVSLWVLRRDRAEVYKLSPGLAELDAAVRTLRSRLDPNQMGGTLLRFDVAAAHELHRQVLPVDPALLDGVRELLIVPHGPLESLPFAVLVATPPAPNAPYREVDWLARRYAMTTLPSVTSLRALRRVAKPSLATEPFRGVGDPILAGHPSLTRGAGGTPATPPTRAIAAARAAARAPVTALLTTRTVADPALVRALPSLPETADELRTFARALGAGEGAVLLGEAATETAVKAADLSRARVVAFATHAGVAGEIEGVSEPVLVLTPPAVATADDDGLLTASEAAQLELDAEFVLLSACNTAAPDGTPGATGLSGLAKAFIYAGSRALFVSHWAVLSDASAELTTGMFAELERDPALGRSEALRRSMMAVLDGRGPAYFTHPAAWAPFVVVGQGGPLARPAAPGEITAGLAAPDPIRR